MTRVTLPGTDLTTSQLGFGSSGGRVSDRQRLRLYRTAFDHGITHFDTARAYGMGTAEAVLGKFLAGLRDQVTVTTKLGIVAPPSGTLFRAARRAARAAERLLPSAGARAKQAAGNRLLTGSRFSVDDMRASLETSLRGLGTDHVDILLLHECSPEEIGEDVEAFLDECVRAGQVRFTGIATGAVSTRAIVDRGNTFPAVVQIANSATEPNLDLLPVRGRAIITHSPLSRGLGRLHAALSSSPELRGRWANELQTDCSDLRTLTALMLSYCLWVNRQGIVLFYSQQPEHLIANATGAFGTGGFGEDQLAAFARLAREQGSSS